MNNESNGNNYLCAHCGLLLKDWRHRCQSLFYYCRDCRKEFSRKFNFERHKLTCKFGVSSNNISDVNTMEVPKKKRKFSMFSRQMREKTVAQENGVIKASLGNAVEDAYIPNDNKKLLASEFLNKKKEVLVKLLSNYVGEWKNLKLNIMLECTYIKKNENTISERTDFNFKSKVSTIDVSINLENYIESIFEKILEEQDAFEKKGSGWMYTSANYICLHLTKYKPFGGSRYIELPKKIRDKRCVINVKNDTNDCFRLAILSDNIRSNDFNAYKNIQTTYSFDSISYPTPISDINRFENLNNLAINVYGLDDKNNVYPIRISKRDNYDKTFDMLYLQNGENVHYCLITNLSRLVSSQISLSKRAYSICRRCLSVFPRTYVNKYGKNGDERKYDHELFCRDYKAIRSDFPKEEKIEFKHVEYTQSIPIVVYADIESFLIPISGPIPNPSTSWNKAIHEHRAFSVSLLVKSKMFDLSPFVYTGENCMLAFLEKLESIVVEADKIYANPLPMCEMSIEENKIFYSAKDCILCQYPLDEHDRVRHHCHISGKFVGPAHNACNLRAKKPDFIPVFMHNLQGYDSHFIIPFLGRCENISVIPSNSEKYISFSIKFKGCSTKIRFVDSFKFLSSSLDTLVNNLQNKSKSISDIFPHMANIINDENKIKLLTRKGVFPYNYFNSFERLNETRLPSKSSFFNDLTQKSISDVDYEHAKSVWETFKIKTLKDYAELYIQTDVILLCEVFEAFRLLCQQIYSLDPAWFFTLPQLSWNAMLKYTKIKLDVIKDIDMVQFFEKGIRGGICQVVSRYAKANNKYLNEYDSTKPSNYLLYVDVNNLYGYAMNLPLPYSDFEWADEKLNVLDLENESEIGAVLDVDIEYPKEIHDNLSQLPFLPEKNNPPNTKAVKLLTTLIPKTRYIVHYVNLKQALQLGVKITKIHRVLKFKQKKWLAPYIEVNSMMRASAKNTFESDFYKLMNNSCFGKFMENVRNRIDLKIVTNEKSLFRQVNKPNFKDRIIFAENVTAVQLDKERIIFDKPLYVGFAVLDLSKVLMYHYHYNVFLKKYGIENVTLCYTDTDSFLYNIRTQDIYSDIAGELNKYFDTSNFPTSHFCFSEKNKKVVGLLKDETFGDPIVEFVGLRPKMYSYITNNEITVKKSKGIKKSAVDGFTFNDYLNTFKDSKSVYSSFYTIQSKKHNVQTTLVNKKSLCSFDNKRCTLPDGVQTLPYGHYSLI